MGKLTALKVKNAKAQLKEIRLSDGNGLFLRVRPSGAKSWIYYFRLPNNRTLHQITIGSIVEYDLSQARDARLELRKQVKQGLDPRQVRATNRTENSQAVTMQGLFESWISFLLQSNAVTAKWIHAHQSRWKNHLKSALGNIHARDINRAHLAVVLENMSKKGIKEETRKALTTLNLMLDYGLQRCLIEQNHARILKPKDFAVSARPPRERVLSLEELRRLWAALDDATKEKASLAKTSIMNVITATAIKLLILTGARRGEVASMCWKDVDLDNGIWEIPAPKTKNRKSHTIFLSSFAITLIKTLAPLTRQFSFVFNTSLDSNKHIHTDSLTKAVRRLIKKDSIKKSKQSLQFNNVKSMPPLKDLGHFTVHDIRRSVSTALGEHLKVAPHIIEKMLNHQPLNKLVRTYQRATFFDEQKQAWLKWGELVNLKIANQHTNVIPIAYASSY